MDLWHEVYAKPRIRESTAVYYKMFIDTHIRPKLGNIKLNQLQTMDIQRLYNDLREKGRIRKEIKDKQPGLSVSYIRGMHIAERINLNSNLLRRDEIKFVECYFDDHTSTMFALSDFGIGIGEDEDYLKRYLANLHGEAIPDIDFSSIFEKLSVSAESFH